MTTPLNTTDILIIGTGVAGVTLAREIRKIDKTTTIHMVTSDDGALYSKPMLSNALAQGKTPDTLVQKSVEDLAADLGVTIWAHTDVIAIDRDIQVVVVNTPQGGEEITYGKLVIASGATPRPYTVPGANADTFKTVNSLHDYARWRELLGKDAKVLIVGAGLIGVEFANDLASSGYVVHVVDPAPSVLGRLLPEHLGHTLQGALEAEGIHLHLGTTVSNVQDGVAVLANGDTVQFDLALSAIGLVPNTDLAKIAGLRVEQGIVVDTYMRTSDEHIFALGDCAQTHAGVLPYILPIMTAARALASTLVDKDTAVDFPAMPVAVKTPALPTVVCPPKPGVEGEWTIEGEGRDLQAIYVTTAGDVIGFALTGERTKARQSLAREMPHLIAA